MYHGESSAWVVPNTDPTPDTLGGVVWRWNFGAAAANEAPNVNDYVARWYNRDINSGAVEGVWKRTATGTPVYAPETVIIADKFAVPVPAPNPFVAPLNVPVIFPLQTPRLRPKANPVEEPHLGVGPKAAPRPLARLIARPGLGVVRSGSPPRRPGPPRRGTREQKFHSARKFAMLVYWSWHAYTEFDDLVDAIWRALPRGKRQRHSFGDRFNVRRPTGPLNAFEKLVIVVAHWEHVRWDRALENIILNQIIDAAVGRTIGAAQTAIRGRGPRTGAQQAAAYKANALYYEMRAD